MPRQGKTIRWLIAQIEKHKAMRRDLHERMQKTMLLSEVKLAMLAEMHSEILGSLRSKLADLQKEEYHAPTDHQDTSQNATQNANPSQKENSGS